jgi:hypothetical protein
MSNFNIPSPGQVSTEPSDYAKQEIADLTPSKRNVVLYEREIEFLKGTILYLQGVIADFRAENAELLRAERTSIESKVKLETVRRSKLEMYVAFAIGTFLMAIGGGLLGTFPAGASSVPWQHAVGWSLIITGAIFGLLSRSVIQFVLHRFPGIAEDWMQ